MQIEAPRPSRRSRSRARALRWEIRTTAVARETGAIGDASGCAPPPCGDCSCCPAPALVLPRRPAKAIRR